MSSEMWRIVDCESSDPYLNMALEEAIARSVGGGLSENTLRIWRNPNTVVIGCFQSVDLEVDPEAYRTFNVKLVRRFTGGGAVYQDVGNLNFSVAVKTPHPLISDDIDLNFRKMSEWVVNALKKLNIAAAYDRRNSILVGDRKISGLSASKRWGSFFLHGTLLINTNIHLMDRILKPPIDADITTETATKSIRHKVTNLNWEFRGEVKIDEFKNILKKSFETTYQVELLSRQFNDIEWGLAYNLYREQYSRPEWNFKK